jgi:hypothetical protein
MKMEIITLEELAKKVKDLVGDKGYFTVAHKIAFHELDNPTVIFNIYHEHFGEGGFDGKTPQEAWEKFQEAEREARQYGPTAAKTSEKAPF